MLSDSVLIALKFDSENSSRDLFLELNWKAQEK